MAAQSLSGRVELPHGKPRLSRDFQQRRRTVAEEHQPADRVELAPERLCSRQELVAALRVRAAGGLLLDAASRLRVEAPLAEHRLTMRVERAVGQIGLQVSDFQQVELKPFYHSFY